MRAKRICRNDRRGQAMLETTLVLMLMLALFVGVYAVSVFANDQNTATTAVRAGGRFGAQLGNMGWQTGTSHAPTLADRQIVAEVCDVARTMPDLVKIDDITVYRPVANSDGSLGSTDLANIYTVDNSGIPGTGCQIATTTTQGTANCVDSGDLGYTLDCRTQTHPNEAQLGVRLRYDYKSPTPIIQLTQTLAGGNPGNVYTVVTLAPIFT